MRTSLVLILTSVIMNGCREELPRNNVVYPLNCFRHANKGGQIIDITKPPFNADPQGKEDCTVALIAAYDYVVGQLKEDTHSIPASATIIYFPNGTYLVSNTIIYSGNTWLRPNAHENIQHIRFMGQSMDGTIIRLADNAPGFGKGNSKPVISFGKHYRNNAVSSNFFENITINTGRGNPGAVALRFHGANNEAVRNVHIFSEDGLGNIGLDMPMGACQGIFKHILIEGFDYGIHASAHLAKSLTLEFVEVRNQHKAGFHLEESSVSIRKFKSRNAVPALRLTAPEGMAVILDSDLTGGTDSLPAIDIGQGVLFARNIRTKGYGMAVRKGSAMAVEGPSVKEYVSKPPVKLFGHSLSHSLNLAVEETPEYNQNYDVSRWACVNDFGAEGDGTHNDTKAIQDALQSGKPVVYFLPGVYLIDSTIEVPSTVERINFMFSQLKAGADLAPVKDMPMFKIAGFSEEPLFFEDLLSWYDSDGLYCMIDHASKRTLVLKDFHAQRGRTYRNSVEGGKVFFENASVRTSVEGSREHLAYSFKGQKVWIRYFDPEYSIPEVLIDHSTVWILGFKTESHATSFEAKNGSKLEILGGVVNSYGMRDYQPQLPALINNNSTVSASFVTGGPESGEGVFFQTLIREIQGGDTVSYKWTEAPVRFGEQRIIPLYLGYAQ